MQSTKILVRSDNKCALARDAMGFLPIHYAVKAGNLDTTLVVRFKPCFNNLGTSSLIYFKSIHILIITNALAWRDTKFFEGWVFQQVYGNKTDFKSVLENCIVVKKRAAFRLTVLSVQLASQIRSFLAQKAKYLVAHVKKNTTKSQNQTLKTLSIQKTIQETSSFSRNNFQKSK